MTGKQLIDILHELGFKDIKSHFKGIDEPMAKALETHFNKPAAKQSEVKPAAAPEHKAHDKKVPEAPKHEAKTAHTPAAKAPEVKPVHTPQPAVKQPETTKMVPSHQPPAHTPAAKAPEVKPVHAPQPAVKQPETTKMVPSHQPPAHTPAAKAPEVKPAHVPQPAIKQPEVKTAPPVQQKPVQPVQHQHQPQARTPEVKPAQPVQPQAKAPEPPKHQNIHDRHHNRQTPVEPPAPVKDEKSISVHGPLSVKEMCDLMNLQRIDVIKKLMNYSIMNVNQRIPVDIVVKIAETYNYKVNLMAHEAEEQMHDEVDDHSKMVSRPPIVTIMGHVDHGKTSLLDAVRKTNVVATEDGGITQHIGAYQVDIGKAQKITFLDTPGHEAFTQMRAHGSKVTDIAILVVAADDGVQPQTIEAIDHAIAAEIPIIVAINKIDKPGANLDNVKKQLAEHGLVPEDWGGDTVCVEVSAKQRINIDGLLEMILLVCEMKQLKADPTRKAIGVVIESKLDKGVGPIATVLIQKGTLRVGDAVIVGNTFGKIRNLTNDRGKKVMEATPSMPVEVIGLNEVPQAGDKLKVVSSEKIARDIATHRQIAMREERMKLKKHISLSDLFTEIQNGKVKDLNIILKGDVAGSIIALSDSLKKLSNEKVRVNVIHSNVGAITENDVLLAAASNAIIIGFRVRPSAVAEKLAETESVDVKVYRIIYDALDQIQHAMVGMYDPTYKEVVLGRAEVRQVFKIPHVGLISGCQVKDGKIVRECNVRVVRGGIEVYEGKVKSLKRFKDDAKEVTAGIECGIGVDKFNDLKEGDILEAFEIQEIKAEFVPNAHKN